MKGLFDHLVGGDQKAGRDRQAERLGGLEVDDQLDPGGLLDGQVCRLITISYLLGACTGRAAQLDGPRLIFFDCFSKVSPMKCFHKAKSPSSSMCSLIHPFCFWNHTFD